MSVEDEEELLGEAPAAAAAAAIAALRRSMRAFFVEAGGGGAKPSLGRLRGRGLISRFGRFRGGPGSAALATDWC